MNGAGLLTIAIIIMASTAVLTMWGSASELDMKFSHFGWVKEPITPDETGALQVRIQNTSEIDYSAAIQIGTKSPDVTISYLDEISRPVNGWFCLTYQIGILRRYEESKLYTFDVSVPLELGTLSKEVELVARVLANGDVMEEKTLALRIKAEG